jgi:hypothetical protein
MQLHKPLDPTCLNQWFSPEKQRYYVLKLTGRHGLTRRRAECFVKLWGYLLLKQQQEIEMRLAEFLSKLTPLEGSVPCTHREAAELFYSDKDRGSDRAAGMMIDQLATLGLVKKEFDGSTITIQIRPLELETQAPLESVLVQPDAFNPKTDAVPAATMLIRNYSWTNKSDTAALRIKRLLNGWAQQYLTGMRVLRRQDNHHAVGFYMLYPVASLSEDKFFLPPSKTLYLTNDQHETDPLEFAPPGDRTCTTIFVRGWVVDAPFMQPGYIALFIEDVQQTIKNMQTEYPNLSDLYAMVIHPFHDVMRVALGFQKTREDNHLPLAWMYQAVDPFLSLDVRQALTNLKVEPFIEKS